jgi:ABC-2 type transport system permease protein
VLLFGTDPTLDPTRFATFAVPQRRLAAGLVLAGLVGLPGLATALLALAGTVAASRSVAAAFVAPLAAALGVLTCVLLSRIVTATAAAMLSSRRGRDLAGVGGLVLVLAVGPVLATVTNDRSDGAGFERLAKVLGWTPLGWPWAAMARAGEADWPGALVCLGLAAGAAVVLFIVWQRVLVSVLRNPRPQTGGEGGHQRGLGLFAHLPGTPMGAIAARAGTYWVRDPRLNFPGLMTALLPAGLLVPGLASDSRLALVAMPLASAYLIGWGQHNDVGYDSTAFWMHVASGVDGVSDRLGRLFPSGCLALVCVPAYAVLGPVLGVPWRLLPATLGVALALLLNGFAVACVTSAVKQYAVPAPGENPFTSRPGSVGVTMGVQAICGAAVFGLSLPAMSLGVAAWFGVDWAAWAALVVGPVLGAVALAVGVRVGAELFGSRQAVLLQDLIALR